MPCARLQMSVATSSFASAASGCRHGSRSRGAGGTWSASGTDDGLAADGRVRYKHVVLGPIFLKYVENAIDERRAVPRDELAADGITSDAAEELLESRDEYTAEGLFWVTPEARWQYLNQRAKQPEIDKLIDNAMDLIEVDNPSLRCMVPKTYARPSLDVRRIGELVDLISSTRGRTSWAVSTSTSSAGAPPQGPGAAASSTHISPSISCSWRCWSHEQASLRVLRLRRHGRAGRAVRRSPRRPAPSCCPHRARALTPVPAAPRLTPGGPGPQQQNHRHLHAQPPARRGPPHGRSVTAGRQGFKLEEPVGAAEAP